MYTPGLFVVYRQLIAAMDSGLQNLWMVDTRGLPPYPGVGPDPRSCKDFAEWLREMTKKGRATQRDIAEVAGASPQAVTKWLKGGAIEPERLARIAEWSGFSYDQLRRLVDEHKIGLMRTGVAEASAPYFTSAVVSQDTEELLGIWSKLPTAQKQQLLGMAKLLAKARSRRK